MKKQRQKNNLNRGEASIVFTFVVLMIVLMGAFTISTISISTIKGSKTGESSALALYAADTGIERGTFEYWWAKGDMTSACVSNNTPTQVTISPTASYSYYQVVDNFGNGTGGCPLVTEISSGTTSTSQLCIEAIGESGGTKRKLSSATGKDNGVACIFK